MRQKLGQHFLGAARWRERIRDELRLAPGDTWLEIGAGHGEMTEILAASGAERVIAVETDRTLVPALRERATEWPAVEILEADILEADLTRIVSQRAGKLRVYGNLPYYITSPILRRLFEIADRISSIDIVIQQEVADRIVAQPGRRECGYLSMLCQFYSRPKISIKIPPGAFRPPPKVNSALVQMTLPGERASLGITCEADFLLFLQRCFEHKRKTLRNNLRNYSEEEISGAFRSCAVTSNARAEQLSLRQLADLFCRLVDQP